MVSSSKSKTSRNQNKTITKPQRDWFAIWIGIAVVAVLAIVGGFFVIQSTANNQQSTAKASKVTPANTINDGFTITKDGIVKAQPYDINKKLVSSKYSSTKTNINMYIDFACPHCAEFEANNMNQIEGWLTSGQIDSVTIHPMAFLSQYSLDAANAYSCVAQSDPSNLLKAQKALTNARLDAPNGQKLVKVLTDAGIKPSDELSTCVKSGKFNSFIDALTKKAQSGPIPETSLPANVGVSATPTVFVNGEKYPGNPDAKVFAQYVSLIKQGQTNETMGNGTPQLGSK